jgi:hypothetical protein
MFTCRIQLVDRAAVLRGYASWQPSRCRVVRGRAHFRHVERHDWFVGGQKRSVKVAVAPAAVL